MRNNLFFKTERQKNSTLQYQSFEHNSMKIYDQQRLQSLQEKKVVHVRT